MKRFEVEVRAKGMTVIAHIDPAAGAAAPPDLLIFGAKRGTPLMQSVLTIGIDLPQKALVCQDEAGTTFPTTMPGISRIARTRRLRQVCRRSDIRRVGVGSQGDEQLAEVGSNVRRVWFRNRTNSGPAHHGRNHERRRRTTEAFRTVQASWLGYGTRNRDVCHGF
jgi:hypothetical protein